MKKLKIVVTKKWLTIILSVIFFIIGLDTLADYGINWDTINHLPRGQAYLHYFLTGKEDYSDLPRYFDGWQTPGQWYWQKPTSLGIDTDQPNNKIPKRSLYQLDSQDFKYYLANDGYGHPPTSDILSSLFNLILFQKLGLINDIDSYHVYGILLASLLVGLIFWWTSSLYGRFAGLLASLSLALYPLFWAEAHFNTEKDVPETVYWSFFIFSIWRSITTRSWKWMLASGLFFGLALGTKFNILFALPVIGIWLIIYLLGQWLVLKPVSLLKIIRNNFKLVIAIIMAIIISLLIFILTWPYLWTNTFEGIKTVLSFYKSIGTSPTVDSRFIWHFGINLYPVKWILYTTPLVILGLSIFGVCLALLSFKGQKNKSSLLFLLWLIIPIIRVSLPGTDIYGGVRQIMEYIPAMAIFAGIGGKKVYDILKKYCHNYILSSLIVLILFIPITVKLIKIHPNENVYFNPIINGLSGAKERNIPYWGNSFGGAYRQGAEWLNANAEKNAKLVYVNELIPNIPRIWLRTDLNLNNAYQSGYLRQGEYAITLSYQGALEKTYYGLYLSKFIRPVYEVKVDGVAILTIWKNDDQHLIKPNKEQFVSNAKVTQTDEGVVFDLGQIYSLSRLEATYSQESCSKLEVGVVSYSSNHSDWSNVVGVLPDDWRIGVLREQPHLGNYIEPFVGQSARYIKLALQPKDTCLKNIKNSKIFYFE